MLIVSLGRERSFGAGWCPVDKCQCNRKGALEIFPSPYSRRTHMDKKKKRKKESTFPCACFHSSVHSKISTLLVLCATLGQKDAVVIENYSSPPNASQSSYANN